MMMTTVLKPKPSSISTPRSTQPLLRRIVTQWKRESAEFELRAVACVGAGRPLGNSRCRSGLGYGQRFDLKHQPIYSKYHHGLARGQVRRRDGVPEFAVDEYLAARGKRSLRDASFTDQSLCAGDLLIAASFESDAHQERCDQSEGDADCERGEQVDAHFRDGRIDEEQSSKSEERDAANGEYAVAGELGLGGEKRECGQNEAQRGKARGQQVESKGRDQ